MSYIIFFLLFAGFIYLVVFNKPKHPATGQLQDWFSTRLITISQKLEHDIELDRQGKYPHGGKQDFESRGSIRYLLHDKNNRRFDLSELDALTTGHIKATEGYRQLEELVSRLNLQLVLDEIDIEGDEVDDDYSLDEHIDDVQRYYSITVSGW